MTNFPTTHGENITFHALLPIHRKILLKSGGLFIQFKQMMSKDFTRSEKNPVLCSPAGGYPEMVAKCKVHDILAERARGIVTSRLGSVAWRRVVTAVLSSRGRPPSSVYTPSLHLIRASLIRYHFTALSVCP